MCKATSYLNFELKKPHSNDGVVFALKQWDKKKTLRENHFTDLRFEWQRGIQVRKKKKLEIAWPMCRSSTQKSHQKTNEMMTKKAGLFYLNFVFALNILAKCVRDDFSWEPDFIKRKKKCLSVDINRRSYNHIWRVISIDFFYSAIGQRQKVFF